MLGIVSETVPMARRYCIRQEHGGHEKTRSRWSTMEKEHSRARTRLRSVPLFPVRSRALGASSELIGDWS